MPPLSGGQPDTRVGVKITRSPLALNCIRVLRGCSEAAAYILKP